MISKFYQFLFIIIFLSLFQNVFAQYNQRIVENEPDMVSTLFDNGAISTGAVSKSGVTAPSGYVWSECQNDTANTTQTNTVVGLGATSAINHLADNFTIPAGQTWKITGVSVWGYLLNWTAPQTPFTGGFIRIWNGRPGDAGSTIVFGDTTTDRLLSSTRANTYVINNSSIPAPGVTPVTTRDLFENKFSVSPTLSLGPGNYWIEFATTTFATGANFYRNVVSVGNRTQAGWNARQFSVASNAWTDVIDGGNPTAAPDVAQDIAFKVSGTVASSVNTSKFMDYDGDGKTDFGVTRWGLQPTDPTFWYILKSSGIGTNNDYVSFPYGVRVGTNRQFSGVNQIDVVLPEDYDGDGKTDVAVYGGSRASAAQPETYFYILNSANSTIRAEHFGTRGDVGNVFGDYDGDGKADLAVWRNGATVGAQSTFYIKKSTTGEVLAIDWGIRNDRPFIGDFNGDGKDDFAVARIDQTTGESVAYILTAGSLNFEVKQIPYPFHFLVPADYDGDGKTDIATIKNSNNDMVWTILRSSDDITQEVRSGVYNTDFPAQGDYDGDGKTNIAVWRKSGTTATNPASFIYLREDGSYAYTTWGTGVDSSIASIRAF